LIGFDNIDDCKLYTNDEDAEADVGTSAEDIGADVCREEKM